jgi:exopolyphosphatase/guanosine-5'-triphosphate,3'-diphosphate pyrophosphatase
VALGTAAMRAAADGAEFAAEIEGTAGVPVSILSGEDEACLAYEAVASGADVALLAVDVGGRSTELVLGRGSQIEDVRSLALGALALTEAHVGDRSPAASIDEVRKQVERALASCDLPARARAHGARVVASGGTATALAALDLGLSAYDRERVHGHGLATECLVMLALDAPASGALDDGRRHILPAGAVVVEAVARAAGAARVVVSDHGIRHARMRALLAEDRP